MRRGLYRIWLFGAVVFCIYWSLMALILTSRKSAAEQFYRLVMFTAFAMAAALCVLLMLWAIYRLVVWAFRF